ANRRGCIGPGPVANKMGTVDVAVFAASAAAVLGEYDRDFAADEFSDKRRQSADVEFRKANFNADIAAFVKARLFQTLTEWGDYFDLIISNQKRGCSTFDQRCKSRIEIAVGAGPENLEPNSERLRRLLQVFCFGFGTWIA